MGRLISLFTLVLLAVPLPAVAGPSAESICDVPEEERPDELVEPVELCGTTIITGNGAASILVRLPEAVAIPEVDVVGPGRFVGIVLADPEEAKATQKVAFAAGRYQKCTTAGCTAARPKDVLITESSGTATIAAGEYRLYLLADGAPASVSLKLQGLDGSLRLDPSTPVASETRSPDCRVETGPAIASCVLREAPALTESNFILSAVWANWPAGPGMISTPCVYAAANRPPAAPFVRSCPEGAVQAQDLEVSSGGSGVMMDRRATAWGAYGLSAGSWNVDQQVDATGTGVDLGGMLVTLQY